MISKEDREGNRSNSGERRVLDCEKESTESVRVELWKKKSEKEGNWTRSKRRKEK